ncbi:hypothetical protein ABPG72_013646 [Tetrahymena utriculariae]
MKYIIICLILASVLAQQEPLKPVWAPTWSQDFVEYFNVTNQIYANVGTYQYNAPSNSSRLSRSNGKQDPFCIGYLNYNTTSAPCEHLTVNNTRWMYYPDEDNCCYCCNAEQGCGILKPDWLQGATFLGLEEVYGTPAFYWVMYEGPNKPNYVWETTEANPLERSLLKIARNNYQEVYIQNQIRRDIQNITLPASCSYQNKCGAKCAVFRGETVTQAM